MGSSREAHFDQGHKPRTRKNRVEKGRFAEEAVYRYVTEKYGWTVIERNWRCKAGEVDLIARDGDWIVFIEVRSRSATGARFGTAREAIDARKQMQVRTVAMQYLYLKRLTQSRVRCDAALVTLGGEAVGESDSFSIDYIKHAF